VGDPSFCVPALEFLLWKWGAFPQALINSKAGVQRF